MSNAGNTLACRYSALAGFEIIASEADILFLVNTITQSADIEDETRVLCQNADLTLAPYDEAVSDIRINSASGHLQIIHLPSTLRLLGDSPSLRLLAENLEAITGGSSPHLHVEYYPGHFFIAEGSEPLIVTKAART